MYHGRGLRVGADGGVVCPHYFPGGRERGAVDFVGIAQIERLRVQDVVFSDFVGADPQSLGLGRVGDILCVLCIHV